MEKLQPLLKHKFWIVTGLVLLSAIVGWWISTSAKAAYIDQRIATLTALTVPAGSGTPNQFYVDGIDEVIKVLDKRQEVLDNRLYQSQQSLHTWPPYIAKYTKDAKFHDPIEYKVRNVYARFHREEILAMAAALPAYQVDPRDGEETGIVWVGDFTRKPNFPHVPFDTWKTNPPTSEEMWDTQEDVWLTRAILEAITKVNSDAGATKISDAPIRTIESLVLRGGSRDTGEAGATLASQSSGEYNGEMPDNYGSSGVSESQYSDEDFGGYGSGGSGITFTAKIAIKLDSVFGSDAGLAATTTTDDASAVGMYGGGGTQKKRRYVDDDPALPYKTRGFYIEVYMMHNKLPDFQAALVSMPWPTELLMIHQVSDKEDDLVKVETKANQSARPGAARFNTGPGEKPGFGGRRTFGQRPTFGGRPPLGGRGSFGGNNSEYGRYGTPNPYDEEGMMDEGSSGPGYFNRLDTQSDTSSGAKAMKDFLLTKIGIAGLMTIYRSPQEREVAAEEAASGPPAETQPAETQPTEPVIDPKTGQPIEPVIDPKTGQPIEPVIDPKTGQPIEPVIDPKTGQPMVPETVPVPTETPEPIKQPAATTEDKSPTPEPPGEPKPPEGGPATPEAVPPEASAVKKS